MNHVEPFRWAILGTGGVSRKFALGLKAAQGHELVVVASRDPNNSRAFAEEFEVESASYESAASFLNADAVYIATPPSQHETHALLAISAKKPVLIEKPFSINSEAAERIRDAANEAGVLVMEAMWTRFLPLVKELKNRIDNGALGELRSFDACFYGNDVPDPAVSLFDPVRGGGALMHRGIYGVSLARYFLGPIVELQTLGRIGDTGIDEDCTLVMRHENAAVSTVRASVRSAGINSVQIYGTKSSICVDPPIYRPFAARVVSMKPREGGTSSNRASRLGVIKEGNFAQSINRRTSRIRAFLNSSLKGLYFPFSGNGYCHEAEAFALAIKNGQQECTIMPVSETIEVMKVIDEAREQMNSFSSTKAK